MGQSSEASQDSLRLYETQSIIIMFTKVGHWTLS